MANDPNQPCVVCGSTPAIKVKFTKIKGMILMHQISWSKGYFCRDCGLRKADEFQKSMLVGGWWSIFGLIGTPIYLAINAATAGKLRKLPAPARATV